MDCAPVPTDKVDSAAAHRSRSFSVRALLIGILLTGFLAWLSPYSIYRLFSSRVHYGILPPGVVAAAVLLIVTNALVGRFRAVRALSGGELVVVIAMMWIGTAALFQLGAIDSMMSVMSSLEYWATPENRWNEYYLRYLPAWAVPSDHAGGIRAFFNGLSPGEPIPWQIWYLPFLWWGSLVAALLLVMICTMTMVHEQWHDREKLTFPMADIPLLLIGRQSGKGRSPGWMRERLFWVGAGVPFAIIAWNTLNWFNPLFPRFTLTQDGAAISFFGIGYSTKLDFFTLGLAYFAPLQILRGFFVGSLLIGSEMAAGMRFGFANGMNPGFEPWSDWGTNTAAWQCSGSMVVFVLWGIWMGRAHFRNVVVSAFRQSVDLPDRLRRRYRVAVWGLIAGLAYLAAWLHVIGMTWTVIVIFLPMVVIFNLGISKLIVESSLLYAENPVSAQTIVMQSVGSAYIPQAAMAALAISYAVFRANAGTMMPQAGFAGRMGDEHEVPRGRLYGALGIAVLVAAVTAVVTVIVLAYQVGAFNFPSLAYQSTFKDAYDSLARKSDEAFYTDWYRVGFFGIGAMLMAIVLGIRARFANFWLHPVGLTFATTSVVGLMTINIFLAWAVKGTLERVGGYRLVERAKPFFLGLVCGHSVGVLFGILVDALWFPGRGHYVLTGW